MRVYTCTFDQQQVLAPDTEYHNKNRSRRVERAEREQWEEPLQRELHALYAPPSSSHDWLTNLINRFAVRKGARDTILVLFFVEVLLFA